MAMLKARRGFESSPRLGKTHTALAAVFGAVVLMSGNAFAQNSGPGSLSFNLSASVAAVEQRNKELENEVERLQKELATAQSRLSAQSSDANAEVQRLKTQLADRESEMAASRAAAETAKQDVAAARADLAIRNQSIVQIDEALTASRKTVAERDRRIQELEAQLKTAQSDVAAARAAVGATTTELEGRRKVMAELEKDLVAARSERDALKTQLDTRTKALQTSEQSLATSRNDLSTARTELSARDKRIEELQAALTTAQAANTASTQRAEKLEGELNAVRAEVAEAERVRIEQERQVRIVQTLPPPPPEKPFPVIRHELYQEMRASLGAGSGADSIDQRFIVQSDGLFERGSDLFSESGLRDMRRIAESLKTATPKFPGSVDWILRIDAHTDDQAPVGGRFPNNEALSSARAQAVVRFLVDQGIPADRVSGTGYAGNHPIDSRTGSEAQQRNRRIELRLAER